jgi:hypothetical protein
MTVPLADVLVLIHVDLDRLAVDARADLNEMAVDLGVVGIFRVRRMPVEEPAATTRIRRTIMMMPRRLFLGAALSVPAARRRLEFGPPRSLTSQIFFVVLRHSHGTGQIELGEIVLVEAVDVLAVGLGDGLLRVETARLSLTPAL